MKRSLVLLYILLVSTIFCVAQTNIKAELDTTKILIGGRTSLKVSVEVHENVHPIFPSFKLQQELTPGVEVLSIKCDTINNIDNKLYITTYILTAWEKNTYKIPSLTITVAGKKLNTKDFLLTVNEIPINKKHAQPKPADTIVEIPFAWLDLIPTFLYLIASIFGLVISYLLYRRMKKNKGINMPKKKIVKLSPYEEALKAINDLKGEAKDVIDQKNYYTKITTVIRLYIYKQFGINALEMTSGEIIEALSCQVTTSKIDELSNLFLTADLVKFAKYSTSETDKEYYLSNVASFIEDTKIAINETNLEPNIETEQEEARLEARNKTITKVIIIAILMLSIALLGYTFYEAFTIVI